MNQLSLFCDPRIEILRDEISSLVCDLLRKAEQELQEATDHLYKLNATEEEVQQCLASVDRALTQCRQRLARIGDKR